MVTAFAGLGRQTRQQRITGEPVAELGERAEFAVQELPQRTGVDPAGVVRRGTKPGRLVCREALARREVAEHRPASALTAHLHLPFRTCGTAGRSREPVRVAGTGPEQAERDRAGLGQPSRGHEQHRDGVGRDLAVDRPAVGGHEGDDAVGEADGESTGDSQVHPVGRRVPTGPVRVHRAKQHRSVADEGQRCIIDADRPRDAGGSGDVVAAHELLADEQSGQLGQGQGDVAVPAHGRVAAAGGGGVEELCHRGGEPLGERSWVGVGDVGDPRRICLANGRRAELRIGGAGPDGQLGVQGRAAYQVCGGVAHGPPGTDRSRCAGQGLEERGEAVGHRL